MHIQIYDGKELTHLTYNDTLSVLTAEAEELSAGTDSAAQSAEPEPTELSSVSTAIFGILSLIPMLVLAAVLCKRLRLGSRAKSGGKPSLADLRIDSRRLSVIAYYALLACFVIPIIYLSFKLVVAVCIGDEQVLADSSMYLLMIIQCALGAFVIHIPQILRKKYAFEIPTSMYLLYLLFLYCAIFLGEVRRYYIEVPFWDDILHAFSSIMTGLFAFMLTAVMNRGKQLAHKLPPLFIALFAFTFSISIGALWEIYEFTMDALLELNMQKYRLDDGTMLAGRAALADTMKDIAVDTLGAFISSLFGYISLKHKRGWINSYIENSSLYKSASEKSEPSIAPLDTELIKQLTALAPIPFTFDARTSLDSTNTALKSLAESGAAEGYVLLAETQTAGRGRLDHSFLSPDGCGIYMSLLLRPRDLDASRSLLLTTAAAVAVATAVEEICGCRAEIKWVNDVYINAKKVCGILTEGALDPSGARLKYAVIGIGINVFRPQDGYPNDLADIAGALYSSPDDAAEHIREHLIASVLERLANIYTKDICGASGGEASFTGEYASRSMLDGKAIEIDKGGAVYRATALRINPDCSLEIVTEDGAHEALTFGEVRVRLTDKNDEG